MRIPRIHLDDRLAPGMDVELPPPAAQHAVRVLRLQAGDVVVLFNGDGNEYPSRLVSANIREASAHIESCSSTSRESPLHITLAQALARGEKMDWIVQKAVELGAAAIVPLVTERSEVKLDAARASKRVAHWRAVTIAACEQSGRCVIPATTAPLELDAWLAALEPRRPETRLVLHPGRGVTPRALQPAPPAVVLAVGPEGGFAEHDLDALHATGFDNLSLGPRILRTETAGLAAIAALQAIYGDL